jgi:hypothetical protein
MHKLAVSLCILMLPLAVLAQSSQGTITGTIKDPAGALIPGAAIEAKSINTGALYKTSSTNKGNYTIPQLPPGPYELTVTASGFKRYVRGSITVAVAQILRVDVALVVGGVTETVTVQAEASLLRTGSGDLSQNITVERMNDLPILGIGSGSSGSSGFRNPNNVTQLIPGISYTPNTDLKVNGAPNNSQNIRVDGQDATNQLISFATQQTQASVDAIQGVSVQTSNFAAEHGQVGGGLINQTTKSGTNTLHSSATLAYRAGDFSAAMEVGLFAISSGQAIGRAAARPCKRNRLIHRLYLAERL